MKTKLELLVLDYLECYHKIGNYNGQDYQEMLDLFHHFICAREALHTPSKLYKFRTCNNNNLRTLEQNCIWMPSADNFLDVSDCNMYMAYDIKGKELERVEKEDGYLSFLKMLNNILEDLNIDLTATDIGLISIAIKKTPKKVTINNHRDILTGVLPEEKETIYFQWVETIYNHYIKFIMNRPSKTTRSFDGGRKIMHVYSMTSVMGNKLLWENYAENYTGFCIEYTIPKEKFYYDDKLAQILPVIYKRKIPFVDVENLDIPTLNDNILNQFKTSYIAEILIQVLYKHTDYMFEHEWRMVGTDLESPLQSFPYVSKIIVGKDIKKRNLERLCKIAKKLDVPICKQVFDFSINKLKYISIS